MTDKQINKWLRRRFTEVGWVLMAYYILMNVLTLAGMYLDMAVQTLQSWKLGNFSGQLDMDAILGNAWPYNLTILVGVIILLAWKGSQYWKEEILARDKNMEPFIFFCMVSFCIGAQVVNSIWVSVLEMVLNQFGLSAMEMLEAVSGDSDTFSMFLYASFLAPIAEEILFRGYVLRSLKPYGKRFAIVCSAILFGLFHGNLLQTPYAVLMGLVLGYLAAEYSIRWSILLHMFNNLVLADLFTRLTAGLPDAVYYTLNTIIFGGFTVVAAILLILKRREIRAYQQSEWIDRRCLKCFFTNTGILAMTALGIFNMLSLLFV